MDFYRAMNKAETFLDFSRRFRETDRKASKRCYDKAIFLLGYCCVYMSKVNDLDELVELMERHEQVVFKATNPP